ncbi:YidC/Oxa1 family membrane protein insertase [Streptomyces yaizuensis]|uniref:Membrane protein insertase YidC n=1 Tax=Streptomyces yaizuensis TaxID=2989713 RepID=A0ABQ5NT29_9ACTN|nr:YidC/Oxa1 family membrane protein insertase [Streptomyces sp. YSPA8]GLF93523.1 YidC/Oxa1 family membrane protein insertase [Streptomyces sp. YSPA8]
MSVFATLVERLADLLQPLFPSAATAAAIVVFTALVRLAVHPLSRAAARGQKASAKLAPRVAELRARHAKNPERLQREVMALYSRERTSPVAGCLPSLLQLPAFFVLYHLFSSSSIGGRPNELLSHTLFAAPLGDRWTDAVGRGEIVDGAGAVYLVLFAIVTAVAVFNYRRTKSQQAAAPQLPDAPPGLGAMLRFLPLLSFATLITVAVVPLAAALYIVTSTTWSAAERALLYRDMPAAGALANPM